MGGLVTLKKKCISVVLICFSLFYVVCVEADGKMQDDSARIFGMTGAAVSGGASGVLQDPGQTGNPLQTQVPASSQQPMQTDQPESRKKEAPLTIKNKGARFFSGGQKGIRHGKVKKGKLYHINTYVSDPVRLLPTKRSTFKITGGVSKKDISSGKIKVSANGTITCTDKARDKKQYAIVQITAKDTGERIYVYVYFAPGLYTKSPSSQVVYQGKSTRLKYNYPYKNIRFVSSNPKVAKVNKNGVVTARKRGTAVILAQVKKSSRNIVKARVTVKEEPWIVNENDRIYSYEDMTRDLKNIAWKYRGKASLKSLGSSEDGRTIWCLRVGNPSAGKKIVIDAGIHAREWMNPLMIVHKCEEILRQYTEYKGTLKSTCLYVVPMINPDGVTISQYGFGAIRSEKLRKLCQKTKASARTWKANARGVNLNFNFPGGWNPDNKSKKPDGSSYPGKKAASEKETKVMMSFINSLSGVRGALNYHSTGSILYWNYNVEGTPALYERQRQLAAKVNSFTRYRLMPKSISTDPNGGFGDWLIYNKKIPNVTVETGSVMCPLPHSQLKKITRENTELLTWFVGEYAR